MALTDTLCVFAWNYPVLNISRNELRNCCRSKAHKISDHDFNLKENLFQKFIPIQDVKKDLLNGIRHNSCSACWKIEDANGRSPRADFKSFLEFLKIVLWPTLTLDEINNKLQNLTQAEKDQIINIDHPQTIEISLNNICDLKCVYCNHHYSSQWATEKLKFNEIKPEDLEDELPKIQDTKFEDVWWRWFETKAAHSVKGINFIGGEPLIIDKFYSYIDRIVTFYSKNTTDRMVDISVVSNFNTPQKYYTKFLQLITKLINSNKFKLDLNISAESTGDKAEFIRTGTDWQLLINNIENFLVFANQADPKKYYIIISLQIAINNLCISDLPNFIKHVIKLQKKYNRPINLRQNQVVYPTWCSPYILTTDYIKYLDETIDLLKQELLLHDDKIHTIYGRWGSYIRFLESIKTGILTPHKDSHARKSFVQNIDQLCQRRNLNFAKTFPEMVEFYDLCKRL